jgi:hypothetical protein
MAVTNIEVINQALVRVGADTITSLTEGTTPAKIAGQVYKDNLRAMLAYSDWNFARKRVTPPKDATGPLYDWTFSYTLPPDCLVVRRVKDDTPFRVEGRKLLTNVDPVSIEYTALVEDVATWNAQFLEAFVLRLAATFALSITHSLTLHQTLLEQYFLQLRDAVAISGTESYDPEHEVLTVDALSVVR